jgi:hypothetical protein
MRRHTVFPRRHLLKVLAALPLAAAAMLVTTQVARGGPIPKKEAEYQDDPRMFQRCSACRFWIMGHTAVAQGTCRIVDGPIDPNGWCRYFQTLPVY